MKTCKSIICIIFFISVCGAFVSCTRQSENLPRTTGEPPTHTAVVMTEAETTAPTTGLTTAQTTVLTTAKATTAKATTAKATTAKATTAKATTAKATTAKATTAKATTAKATTAKATTAKATTAKATTAKATTDKATTAKATTAKATTAKATTTKAPTIRPTTTQKADSTAEFSAEALRLTNKARAGAGRKALGTSAELQRCADIRAEEIKKEFSHTRPNGQSCFSLNPDLIMGENIASGQKTPQEVVNGWMNSKGHRENILRERFTLCAVGCSYDKKTDTYYWVQLFG